MLRLQNLQCGGALIVPGEYSKDFPKRAIIGCLLSITKEGKKSSKDTLLLDQVTSNLFKMGPLREKLGEFFDYS